MRKFERQRIITDPAVPEGEYQGGAKQSMKDECDINNIVRKFAQTGVLTHVRETKGAMYGVIPEEDFMSAMLKVRQAEETFEALPASLRKKFLNSPAEFMAFASDPENLDEMRKLGLANPEAPRETSLADVVEAVNGLKPEE